jgi:basic amino acid/polyamine antiporter, APA family
VTSGELRRLGTADAVVLGLAAMLGTGVFAVWGPAAAAAGAWLPLAVLLAGVVAACNAASSADLAVRYPESGGGYVYGHELIHPAAGRLAGVAFLVGKLSSAAAAAGVFGQYVLPSAPMAAAIPAVLVVTVLNTCGVRWTARGAYSLVGGTLVVLLVVVVIGYCVPVTAPVPAGAVTDQPAGGVLGVLTAAGLVFFAFAGYARIATMAGEVVDPGHTIRRAIAISLGIALVTYLLVASALLIGLGPERLAGESTPLVVLVDGAGANALGVLIRVGAAVAAGSALLSVLVGVSRTAAAMARRGDLPARLGRIGPRGTPWRADAIAGLVVVVVALLAGPAAAIALSACSVLVYYAVVNLAALRLPAGHRTWPAWVSALGLLLCLGLALLLPLPQVLTTAAALVLVWSAVTVRRRRR